MQPRVRRIAGIDIARGVAIYLMFQSHTVKGLLFFRDMPAWGIVPMHAVTKLSSSLFVLVFGVTLGLIFVPRTLDPQRWPATRHHMWWRALLVFFWYKILIVVQTFQTRPRDVIIDMLLYKRFPDFVEILDFYAWILLALPLLLPLWRRLPLWAGAVFTAGLALLGQLLFYHFDFFGVESLKAIFVESDKQFCFGLLTRGPLALLGLLIGDAMGRAEDREATRRWVSLACIAAGVILLAAFVAIYQGQLHSLLTAIARNKGKHPPQFFFMSFSLGGALILLGACLLLVGRWTLIFKPLSLLGRESLTCFVWHILMIFVGLRWALDLKRVAGVPKVSYTQALLWTGAVTLSAMAVAQLNIWRKQWRAQRQAEAAALAAFAEDPDTLPDARPPDFAASMTGAVGRNKGDPNEAHRRAIEELLK